MYKLDYQHGFLPTFQWLTFLSENDSLVLCLRIYCMHSWCDIGTITSRFRIDQGVIESPTCYVLTRHLLHHKRASFLSTVNLSNHLNACIEIRIGSIYNLAVWNLIQRKIRLRQNSKSNNKMNSELAPLLRDFFFQFQWIRRIILDSKRQHFWLQIFNKKY